jgi:hypothetical protein
MASSTRFQVRLRVGGELGPSLSAVFAGLSVEPGPAGTTLVSGELSDQAAVHGLMAAIRDLGLQLISVETLAVSDPSPRKGGAS